LLGEERRRPALDKGALDPKMRERFGLEPARRSHHDRRERNIRGTDPGRLGMRGCGARLRILRTNRLNGGRGVRRQGAVVPAVAAAAGR